MKRVPGRRLAAWSAALLLWCGAASAQWTDGFESYGDTTPLEGQGGWHGWDGVNTEQSLVASQFASEGLHSVMVQAGADTVHEFDDFDSGHWTVAADLYLPSSFVGKVYFLIMNAYANGGPYQWSVQIGFNGDTGEVECNCGSGTPVTVPLVLGEWVEVRCDVNISTDLTEIYYDGNLLGSYPWSAGPFGSASYGLLQIDAIALFSDVANFPHVTEVYFDNLRLTAHQGEVGTAYCFGDGSGAFCPCGNFGGLEEGCAHGAGVGARLSAYGSSVVPMDDLVFTAEQMVATQPALLFAADNAVNGGFGNVFGDGLRCAGGNLVRLGVRMADGTGHATWGPGLGASGGWLPGDTRRFQSWFRDPQLSPCGAYFNLSTGLEINFVP